MAAHRPAKRRSLIALAAAGLMGLALAPPALAEEPDEQVDLSRLSLEELAQVEITSVSRRPEPLSEAASAIHVITADDIRRSGVASLPEVLRLAPNLQVQRLNAADYAISARGFNGFETANKLLVLIDGRSVYSPLHSGVFWDAQGVMLEDVERIEVVSGPGGTLYGANAVNGVINITTRPAGDTQGGLVAVGGGTDDRTLGLRWGGRLGEGGAARAYLMAFDREENRLADGRDGGDAVSGVQGGFRADWGFGGGALTLQGDAYRHDAVEVPDVRGANLLGRWARDFGTGGALELTGYLDRTERIDGPEVQREDTFDLHGQHAFAWGERHRLVVGGGYRRIQSAFESAPGAGAFLEPADRDISLANLFVQDQIALSDDLTLTLGVKFEESSLSGGDYLPNARLAWRPDDRSLLWAAVSRAVRTANRIERDLTAPGFLIGGTFESERLVAYEAGYRANPRENLSFSVSVFYNDYDRLRTTSFAPGGGLPLRFANGGEGRNWGLEAWGAYDVGPAWRLSGGVSTLGEDFQLSEGATDLAGLTSTGDDPAYQVLLRSQSTLAEGVELDVRLRAVDELNGAPSYAEADVRLGWQVRENLELSLTGANLLHDERVENSDLNRRRVLGRSLYAQLRWRP